MFPYAELAVKWQEPKMLANCFAQAMLAKKRNFFSPSCNPDGTYAAKQCHLER